jgi:hypothetical protein
MLDFSISFFSLFICDHQIFKIFRYGRWMTRKVACFTIAIIWMMAALGQFNIGFYFFLMKNTKYTSCTVDYVNANDMHIFNKRKFWYGMKGVLVLSFIIFFF